MATKIYTPEEYLGSEYEEASLEVTARTFAAELRKQLREYDVTGADVRLVPGDHNALVDLSITHTDEDADIVDRAVAVVRQSNSWS